ncbi:sugar transferase [Bdellovibrio sp. NC01]|uniref:sugar transferase n=1 Tax=Bdellovibrio sp. NC01 TaxID=2220073 RepID=UPI001159CC97|nr:sugar transferase [Bdellovibrio sp. NC01]QDK37517.1 sugar transferase [Bdellovibrio sp. NC01]
MWLGKRIFDFAFSAIGLLVLSPLFLFVALWIKYDSKGPVFFKQQRVGLNGRVFWIHKFRTMSVANDGLQITVAGDSRITQSGAFLRKYKIDELAQLIDVFLGRMSLVGPRPEVPRYVEMYPESLRTAILSVKPGITDWASVEFKNENEILAKSTNPEVDYIKVVLPEKLRFQMKYIESASLIVDLKIIFLTLKAIVFGS